MKIGSSVGAFLLWFGYIGCFRLVSGGAILGQLIVLLVVTFILTVALVLRNGFGLLLEQRLHLWVPVLGLGYCAGFALAGIALRSDPVVILGWVAAFPLALLFFEMRIVALNWLSRKDDTRL